MPRTALPLAILLAGIQLLAPAQENASGDDARNRLQQSIDYLSSLPAYSVDLAMDFSVQMDGGESHETSLTGHLSIAGDDNARFRVEVPDGHMELFYTSDSKHIYLKAQNKYVDGSAFPARQNALTAMPGKEYRPAQILLSDLVHDDFTLADTAESVQFIARDGATENGPDQIRVTGGGLTVDFWIRAGEQPLLEKFTLDMTQMVAQSTPSVREAAVNYTFSNWNVAPEFAEGHFAFVKPEGATELERAEQQRPTDPLEGQPAPPITLDLLGSDGKLDLAAHKGKDVVILDFWASWCGPCRIGLPIVTEVAEAFKDKGVVLYTVNVGESVQRAKAFADETGLTAKIALDTESKAAQLYGASSIPLTIIIDREGTVHEVHRGVSPALKQQLTATLTELTE